MSVQENVVIAHKLVNEGFWGGNLSVVDELIDPEFVNLVSINTGEAVDNNGIEAFKQEIIAFHNAVPDLTGAIDETLAEGDKVMLRLHGSGTHSGNLCGVPPTGKYVSNVASITIFKFK
ncbi:ester cyclase, partial [bacterium]|nr:ester cyclase [bacterium]